MAGVHFWLDQSGGRLASRGHGAGLGQGREYSNPGVTQTWVAENKKTILITQCDIKGRPIQFITKKITAFPQYINYNTATHILQIHTYSYHISTSVDVVRLAEDLEVVRLWLNSRRAVWSSCNQ